MYGYQPGYYMPGQPMGQLEQLRTSQQPMMPQPTRPQNQQIFGLQLAASQAAQNSYLVQTLRPCPTPAYVVANPYCCNQQLCGG